MAGNPPGSGPGNKSGKRNGKKLVAERLDVVDSMLHKCYTHSAILSLLSREWDIKPRQVRNYIRKVYEMWAEDAKKTLVDRVSLRRTQLEQVLEDAMHRRVSVRTRGEDGKMVTTMVADPDLKTAVQALDRLCKVDGAFAPLVVETKVSPNDITHMTSNDKRKALAELMDIANKKMAAKTVN